MSVLIKDMEMPTTCRECVIGNPKAKTCIIGKPKMNTKRRDDCPLVEIPTPHGRLIDADEFKADYGMKNECADCEKELKGTMKSCEYDRIYSKMDFCQWLDNADTVIDTEGSEE